MPNFSAASLAQRATLHPDLQRLADRVVLGWDCTILEGKRSVAQQLKNIENGVSKTMASKHVYPEDGPSLAMDLAPYPLKWPDKKSVNYIKELAMWYAFGGYVMGIAEGLGIRIRWGGDWDGDWVLIDQTFDDLPHFELVA